MKKNTQESAPLIAQMAYKLNGVTYLPHYRNASVYVGPGYPKTPRYSAEQLALAGATAVNEMLWVRGNHGIVTDIHP
jgi:hypothetical protein